MCATPMTTPHDLKPHHHLDLIMGGKPIGYKSDMQYIAYFLGLFHPGFAVV